MALLLFIFVLVLLFNTQDFTMPVLLHTSMGAAIEWRVAKRADRTPGRDDLSYRTRQFMSVGQSKVKRDIIFLAHRDLRLLPTLHRDFQRCNNQEKGRFLLIVVQLHLTHLELIRWALREIRWHAFERWACTSLRFRA